MVTKVKKDADAGDGTDTGEGQGKGQGEGDPKGKTADGEDVTIDKAALADAIREVLPGVLKTAGGAGGDDADKGKALDPPAPTGGTLRAQEADVQTLVERELARVTKERERDAEIGQLKKAVEKPPSQFRRLTKLMWGNDDETKR